MFYGSEDIAVQISLTVNLNYKKIKFCFRKDLLDIYIVYYIIFDDPSSYKKPFVLVPWLQSWKRGGGGRKFRSLCLHLGSFSLFSLRELSGDDDQAEIYHEEWPDLKGRLRKE